MATSRRTQLYKVRSSTYCVYTTFIATKLNMSHSVFEWKVKMAAVEKMQPAMCCTYGPEAPLSPGAEPQQNYQSKSLNLPYISLGPFEDVQLFQEWDYKLMFSCAFHASVPRDLFALYSLSAHTHTVSFLSLFHLSFPLPSKLASQIWPKVAFDKWDLLSTRLTAN